MWRHSRKNMKIAHDAGTPQILIYHTHSLEGYADSIPGDRSTTVVGVGDYLTELLTQQYGYNVIHDTGEYDTIRDKAYSKSGSALEQILADNPGIDGGHESAPGWRGENTRLVTNVNGTDMAKVMFFNGLSRTTKLGDIAYLYNPYIADNLAFSFQMRLAAAEYYPGYTRKIYLKKATVSTCITVRKQRLSRSGEPELIPCRSQKTPWFRSQTS